ncbi:acylphosphatase [Amphiplicatus metriothermophilus]|uniref:acylphosphatase n=1 Tax=Amphiplicatus metriothermophilus TaxID=1519374 RepID=A0A239PJF1_9PROT|nr:acylphosphatase [Amphiplicatus metriothermophilus]MBB5517758.1 acylphosphatase [Amphiplicatus metriothermophilus]SNT67908.1 acylphosphatase [Amphiplicatus metriothermophilus]
MAEDRVSVRLVIRGRVQGVGYRAWVGREARAGGLDGWARNRADGSVEALVSGAPERTRAFIEKAWRGPPAARVTAIDQTLAEAPVEPGFRILPTV